MFTPEEAATIVAEVTRIRQLLERLVLEPEKKTEDSARRWLTSTEAATYLRMKPTGLRSLIARGRITSDGRGRRRCHMFYRETLDAYLAGGTDDESTTVSTKRVVTTDGSIERPRRAPTRTLRDLVQAAEEPRAAIPTELLSSTRNAMGRGRTP